MSLNLALLLRESAKIHPDDPALVIADTKQSYSLLHDSVQRFAGALKNLGLEPGQHVALMLPNVPQFTVAYYGSHYAANPVVPLNVLLTTDEILYHLDDSDAVALVAWEGFADQAKAAVARSQSCKHLILATADPGETTVREGAVNMTAMIREGEPVTDLPATSPDDTAVILYTSGTTGRPKGAELTHFNMFYNAQYARNDLMHLDSETVALATLPLFHSFGQTCVQNATLGAGGTVVLLPRFEPKVALEAMHHFGVTYFAGVPTMYYALLAEPEADQYPLSLEICVSGGSAMPVEVMKAFDRKYGVDILEGYGLSETSPVASFNVLDRPKKAGSVGLPIWGCEFRLVDTDGNVVDGVDVPGEICIKGHNVMKGYYNKPEATREALSDGWFSTGDIGTRDSDGYYTIVDRRKDMLIRGGFNVYPREVEELLYGHSAVGEAAVIGVPHERHGEEIKAIIVCKPGKTAEASEIIEYCKEKLAAYKYPRLVEFRDALPKGPTGKILKRELE